MAKGGAAVLLELVKQYDKLRTEHSALTKEKDETQKQIKDLIGDKTEVAVPGWKVTYRNDKDKEVTSFDEEKFAEKDPKKYAQYQEMLEEIAVLTKKYTKVKTVPGSRRLIIESGEE